MKLAAFGKLPGAEKQQDGERAHASVESLSVGNA